MFNGLHFSEVFNSRYKALNIRGYKKDLLYTIVKKQDLRTKEGHGICSGLFNKQNNPPFDDSDNPPIIEDGWGRINKNNCYNMQILGFDYDCLESLDLLSKLKNLPFFSIYYETFNSTLDNPRARVIVPIDHPLHATQFNKAIRSLGIYLDNVISSKRDENCENPSRIFYTYRKIGKDGRELKARVVNDNEPILSKDSIFNDIYIKFKFKVDKPIIEKRAKILENKRKQKQYSNNKDSSFFTNLLKKSLYEIENCKRGNRNNILNKKAYSLYLNLEYADISLNNLETVLLRSAEKAGLKKSEAYSTIQSAFKN